MNKPHTKQQMNGLLLGYIEEKNHDRRLKRRAAYAKFLQKSQFFSKKP